jgi:hypothetical protein
MKAAAPKGAKAVPGRAASPCRSWGSLGQILSSVSSRVTGKRSGSGTRIEAPWVAAKRRRQEEASEAEDVLRVVHQVGLVGGESYDAKAARLDHILERLPAEGRRVGICAASAASVAAVEACLVRLCKQATLPSRRVATPCRSAGSREESQPRAEPQPRPVHLPLVEVLRGCHPEIAHGLGYVINYDIPDAAEYVRRVRTLSTGPQGEPGVVYTLVDEAQLKSKTSKLKEVAALLRRAKKAAMTDRSLGGAEKGAELESTLQQLAEEEEQEEDEEEEEDDGDQDWDEDGNWERKCDCVHCRGGLQVQTSFHTAAPKAPVGTQPRVEVVRMPLRALEDLDSAAPLMAPRLQDHACTLICLHNMYCHTPWDGHEHLFALPEGMGTVRVVIVLANGGSWHDYPDVGTFSGGVPWMDILDMESMDRTDKLLEGLMEHEVALLGGRSERLVLMGASQGGGQSMLRFLRSTLPLGGWIGAVCHAPTAPHTPRDADPLLAAGRPKVNCDRPMRLLAGQVDSTFPVGLVRRDAERLRREGGFTDLLVKVQRGLNHEERKWEAPPVELVFVQQHLPKMLPKAEPKVEEPPAAAAPGPSPAQPAQGGSGSGTGSSPSSPVGA